MDFLQKDEEWTPFHIKVFSRWASYQIKPYSKSQINDITKDLTNGVSLLNFANILTQSKTPQTSNMQKNFDLAIKKFAKDGVNLIGITRKNINNNNEQQILTLIWSLILHYSIDRSISPNSIKDNEQKDTNKSKNSSAKALMSWALDQISNYPNINNFRPYDLSICALLDSYVPERINYYSLNPKNTKFNMKLAIKVMNDLRIPVFVFPEDVISKKSQIDDKIILTQISAIKIALDSQMDEQEEEESDDKKQKINVGIEKETDLDFEDEIGEASKAKDIAEAEVDRLTRELATAESDAKLQEEKMKKEISQNESEIDRLKSEIDQLNEEKAEFEVREAELKNTIDEIQKKSQIELENTRKYGTEAERIARGLSQSLKLISKDKIENNTPSDIELENEEKIKMQLKIDSLTNELKQAKEQIEHQNEIIEKNKNEIALLNELLKKSKNENKGIQEKELEAERIAMGLSESIKQMKKDEIEKENLDSEKLSVALSNANSLNESKEKALEEIERLKLELKKSGISESYEKKKREEAENKIDELELTLFKLNDESKRYKNAADFIIKDLSTELNSVKEQNEKLTEVNKQQKITIKKQKKNIDRSEHDIIALTSLLRDSKKEAYKNKEQLIEAERITKCLSESLKKLDEESKKQADADRVAISCALVDAQNEREAKETAQSVVERLSNELSKTVEQATSEKNSKEIALQNIDTLILALQEAFKKSEISSNKAEEAGRIARGLSESLNELHHEYQQKSEEAEEERKAKENATVELERLSNKIIENVEIAQNQKIQSETEINRLTGELGSLETDVQNFKEANERAALKIQELHTALIKAEAAARDSGDKEFEATRIAEALSKSLKELDIENKACSTALNEAVLNSANEKQAKEEAQNEVDRLSMQLNNIKNDFNEFKEANERAAFKIEELHTELIKAQRQAKINEDKEAEAERIASELSESLKELNEKAKVDQVCLTHALIDAQKEREEKESAQSEIQRLSDSLNRYKYEAEKEKRAKELAIHNIEILTISLEKALRDAEISKNKANEAERITRTLTESLNQMLKEYKYRFQVDEAAISKALMDAQNEREAKEIAQSDVQRLSTSLSKYETEAVQEKHAKEVAEHNVDILTAALENAFHNAENNRVKAQEAERIARGLAESLKTLHHDYKKKAEKDEETISKLAEEAENERKAREDATYEAERLYNKMTETEEIAQNEKNHCEFEIDRLTGQLGNLEGNIEEFKEANEKQALKIEELQNALDKTKLEAKKNGEMEAEATRIAECLSKSLKELSEEKKCQLEENSRALSEAISEKEKERLAKEDAVMEINRLTNELEKARYEVTLHKEARKKAELEIMSLMTEFQKLQKDAERSEAVRMEAERLAKELSISLKEARFQHEQGNTN